MSEINCTVEQSNSSQTTVGSPFKLHCASTPETWVGISPDKAEIKLTEADQYKLKLLKLDFTSPNEATLTVTSYKPGTHKLAGVQVIGHDANGDHVVALSPLDFAVVSVMDAKTPQEEPYGPLGPIKLSLPVWYWLVVAGVLLFFAGLVWYRVWQRSKKKKLLSKMTVFETAQTPYFQFHQSIRKVQREIGFATEGISVSAVKELSQAYKVYLARTFLIPTMDWSEKQILSDLKKNYSSIYSEHRNAFKKSLAELSRAQVASDLAPKDVEQLLKLLRDHIDKVEPLVVAQKSKKTFGGLN